MTTPQTKDASSGVLRKVSSKSDVKKDRTSLHGLYVLFGKELGDHLHSVRFILVFALLTLTSIVGMCSALSDISDSTTTNSDFLYLTLFTTSSSSIPAAASFIAFLGPLAGIVIGFDAINRERSLGTLNRLSAQPIYRDAIINGKFLSGLAAIALVIFALGGLICGVGLLVIGIPPQAEEVGRIIAFLVLTVIYISFWLALSILFSVIWRHAATAALAGITIWIVLTFFMSMIAGGIADLVYPLDGIEGFYNSTANYELELAIERVSPYYLFCEAASTILNPNVRSIGLVTNSQLTNAISGYLPLGQSLLLVWAHVVTMIALSAVCFAASYISFMRQEIRA